jgi:uncharacterized repeat protein (TIGR03803 family)
LGPADRISNKASIFMQRTAFPRRRPLVFVIVGLAGIVMGAAALAAPLVGNLIGVYQFITGLTASTDLAGAAATGGTSPRGELLAANDGNFYVALSAGGSTSVGAVMRVTPSGTATVVHEFAAAATDGATPYAGLIQASDGALYGTTFYGGANSYGTVYKLALDGTFTNLHSFGKAAQGPYNPYTALLQGPDGALYGTTLAGGTSNQGTVFRITTDGTLTVLLSFTGTNGASPEGQLVVGADGALYGTTMMGGDADRGTLYKITTTGTYTRLYSFSALNTVNNKGQSTNTVGSNPRAGLTFGSDGNFYGTAYQGGPNGLGTVFMATPTGAVTVVHSFSGSPTDGAYPVAPVTRLADGTLYGTTLGGGFQGAGVAWRLSAAGDFALLHSFANGPIDNQSSYTGLLPFGGFLYGLTYGAPGSSIYGAMYKIDEGTGGVPPITFAVSPESIVLGATATLTWSSATAATCVASGAWLDTIGTAGTLSVTPTAAGVYTYALACTDGAGVVRNIKASLVDSAPPAQSVEGGAIAGGGALGLWSLTLLGGAAGAIARRRFKAASLLQHNDWYFHVGHRN